MGQIEVRSKATGKTRFITERNLAANEDKFERVTGNISEVPKYTSEKESEKKKAARVAGETKPKKQENAEDSKSPE